MAATPKPVRDRVPHLIKTGARAVALHARQIASLQSATAGLAGLKPGPWTAITLSGGWSNIPGFIPAQVRLLQSGLAQVTGHIRGGNTNDATVIGSLGSGFYNTSHASAFAAVVMAGAGAVGKVGAGMVTDTTVLPASLPTAQIPSSNHTVNSTPFTLGPSGVQFQNIPPGSFTASTALQNNAVVVTTVLSANTPLITLDTAGHLTISSFDDHVTQVSFSGLIPLTA